MASVITFVVGTVEAPPFHEALRRLRVYAEMSHRDVGQRVGVKPDLVARWELSEELPTPRQFARLRDVCFRELRVYRKALAERWKGHGASQAEIDAAAQPVIEAGPESEPLALEPPAVVEVPPPRPQDAETFGGALRRARMIEGMSQAGIAEILNVNDSTVSQWELDQTVPIVTHYGQLLDLLPALAECVPPRGLPQDITKPGPQPGIVPRTAALVVAGDRPMGLTLVRGATAGAAMTAPASAPTAPPSPSDPLRYAGIAYAEALAAQAAAEAEEREAEAFAERAQVAADEILVRAQEAADRVLADAGERRDAAIEVALLARKRADDKLAELRALAAGDWRTR